MAGGAWEIGARSRRQVKEKARLDGSRVKNSLARQDFEFCRSTPPNFSRHNGRRLTSATSFFPFSPLEVLELSSR